MKLLAFLLVGVILSSSALAQSKDAAPETPMRNEEFHNTSTNYFQRSPSIVQRFTFDRFNPLHIAGHYNVYEFHAPGFSWGNNGGWAVQHGTYEKGTFNTRGIGQMYGADSIKHAVGDFAAQYVYAYTDGGTTAQSDEGFTLDTREGGETDNWFHGTAAAGAAPGTTLLPVTYIVGQHSQSTTTDGAYMLDITKGTISGIVTGPGTLVEGTSVHLMPVSVKLPLSTGIGIVDTVIPKIKDANVPEEITLTKIRLIHGSFVTGKACLAGGWYPEQVLVTKTEVARSGLQDVTIIHKNPNGKDANNPTSIWQGGVCGQYLSLDRNMERDGFRTSYEVVGATDPTHLAYVWNIKGGTKQGLVKVYQPPVPLKNLSRSGGIVTASFAKANATYIFNHAATVVIADASNASFNATVHSPTYEDDLNLTLQWPQGGPDETTTTATIDLPPTYYGFHLYPGAEVLGPQVAGGVPLEPNSVEWTPGDVIENPHHPSFAMNGRMTGLIQHTLNSFNSNGDRWGFGGSGISANYRPSTWTNDNPCSLYVGCGGTLDPIRWDTFGGPYQELINVGNAPLNQGSLFTVGCDSRGCDHMPPYRLFQLQHGAMIYDPADGNFTVPRMTASLFSGRLDGPVTTTQIDLQDPKTPALVLTITNSGGRVVLSQHGIKPGTVPMASPAFSTGDVEQDTAEGLAATVVPGQDNAKGDAVCAKGYRCMASSGRLIVTVPAAGTSGLIATVKTTLPVGAICTATQNGGSSFLGIGSGRERTNGFAITAGVTVHGTVTVDYSCH